jgi:AraC family transcriptional activator FtrA
MHTVAAVIDQGALTFDLAIPCEVFGYDRRDVVDPWYAFLLVAAGNTPVRTQTGFDIDTPHRLDSLAAADTIVIPGWADPDRPPSDALCDALRAAHARGARIASLCTGAFVLAYAGLLDGRRATTHWRYADRLQARHPDIRVDPNPLYVSDGAVHTSAGTAAGIDLCLALVAADHGAEVAATVARRLVMPLHRPGGQAQYVDAPIEPPAAEINALLDWARERLGDGIRVDDLATHAALSTRSLTRHFARHVGTTPGEWLAQERLRLAQRLLERTTDPVATVARRAGYASPATLRAQFAARLDTSPRGYRLSMAMPEAARDRPAPRTAAASAPLRDRRSD